MRFVASLDQFARFDNVSPSGFACLAQRFLHRLVRKFNCGMCVIRVSHFESRLLPLHASQTRISKTLKSLWKLEDKRFSFCMAVMDMLEKKPKIGLDGGFQKPKMPLPKESAVATPVGQMLLCVVEL
jgi:hypothetical protein